MKALKNDLHINYFVLAKSHKLSLISLDLFFFPSRYPDLLVIFFKRPRLIILQNIQTFLLGLQKYSFLFVCLFVMPLNSDF